MCSKTGSLARVVCPAVALEAARYPVRSHHCNCTLYHNPAHTQGRWIDSLRLSSHHHPNRRHYRPRPAWGAHCQCSSAHRRVRLES